MLSAPKESQRFGPAGDKRKKISCISRGKALLKKPGTRATARYYVPKRSRKGGGPLVDGRSMGLSCYKKIVRRGERRFSHRRGKSCSEKNRAGYGANGDKKVCAQFAGGKVQIGRDRLRSVEGKGFKGRGERPAVLNGGHFHQEAEREGG